MTKRCLNLIFLLALIFSSSSCQISLSASPTYPAIPYELISLENIFAYLTDLTAIQPYSGWCNSGSSGETEVLDYVAGSCFR